MPEQPPRGFAHLSSRIEVGAGLLSFTLAILIVGVVGALSVRETDKLLAHLGELKQEGVSAVFITHNLYHAYERCDRFTILSHGKVIRNLLKSETSVSELNEIIVKY